MARRPEFQLLDEYFDRIYHDVDLSQDFLRDVGTHIELCEYIVEADEDKSRIVRTVYWWRKRAALFGRDIPERILTVSSSCRNRELTDNDRRFLRSLRIETDGLLED